VDLKSHGRRHGQVHWVRQLLNQKGEKVQEGTLVTLVMRGKPLSTRPVRTDSAHGDLMTRAVPAPVGPASIDSAPVGLDPVESATVELAHEKLTHEKFLLGGNSLPESVSIRSE
jgi:hypothetical protein